MFVLGLDNQKGDYRYRIVELGDVKMFERVGAFTDYLACPGRRTRDARLATTRDVYKRFLWK